MDFNMTFVVLDLPVRVMPNNAVFMPSRSVSGPMLKWKVKVIQPLKLYQSDLDKMKRITVNHKGHDSITNSYTGVPLIEILNLAHWPT